MWGLTFVAAWPTLEKWGKHKRLKCGGSMCLEGGICSRQGLELIALFCKEQ